MPKVERKELLDYQTYSDGRNALRDAVMKAKEPRRIHVGDALTFLFENHQTVRYQIQEMMRVEHIVKEADIQHELDTYNALLGDDGELGCTLLIEIDEEEARAKKLRQWRALPEHLYLKLDDGRMVRPTYDKQQMDDERLSAVQFLKFEIGAAKPIALGSDLPQLTVEAALSAAQQAALLDDLRGS